MYKPLLAAGLRMLFFWLPCGNLTTKRYDDATAHTRGRCGQAAIDVTHKIVELKNSDSSISYWKISYWILMCLWIGGALLFMNEVNAGFLNSYLSDLAFPPWFYIQMRGLYRKDRRPTSIPFIGKWFGLTPLRAGISIFIVGLISELAMLIWPKNLTSGTFDRNDIIAYAFGLFICVIVDIRQRGDKEAASPQQRV